MNEQAEMYAKGMGRAQSYASMLASCLLRQERGKPDLGDRNYILARFYKESLEWGSDAIPAVLRAELEEWVNSKVGEVA